MQRSQRWWVRDTLVLLIFLLSPACRPAVATAPTAITITISGTVTGPHGPAAGVSVNANAHPLPYGAQDVTDAQGRYQFTIQTEGSLNIHVWPPLATRLAQVNLRREGITGSFQLDIAVPAGYLLSLRAVDREGRPVGEMGHQLLGYSLATPSPPGYLSEYHLYWDGTLGRYRGVLPPDVYTVSVDNPPPGYPRGTGIYDLRSSDQVVDLVLGDTASDPRISYPPDVSKITIGSPDGLDEATVTGAPGAVVSSGHVMLTNLSSWHQVQLLADADGSFSTTIYAPPGSALYIQHAPLEWMAAVLPLSPEAGYDVYPGTIIDLPHTHTAPAGSMPFAAVGSVERHAGVGGIQVVGAAWSMTGTVRPTAMAQGGGAATSLVLAPGDSLHVQGTLRITGQAITRAFDPTAVSASGWWTLRMLHNGEGLPIAPHNPIVSTRLTPSGLPIRDPNTNGIGLGQEFVLTGMHLATDHAVEGTFEVTFHIPGDTPAGIYRPVAQLQFSGVPLSSEWTSAGQEISYRNYFLWEAPLPPITISPAGREPVPPRLLWRLLIEDNVQGTRGAGAREDVGRIGLSSFIVTQGAPCIARRADPRSHEPIVYRLEPSLPMISSNVSTYYSPPSPPLIPLALPGGQLHVTIQAPDGTIRDLGSEPFAQCLLRAKTTSGGFALNPGTVRLDHAYTPIAASDRFQVSFDQTGHHVISLSGQVSDIWGNRYDSSGTYDVWVAEPLALAPGVLPGTPFDVGDALNPSVQTRPGVPAWVEWTLTEYPYSDPARAVSHTVRGWASRFGTFDAPGFTLGAPGEYRVDLVARYQDPAGVLWMGSMTWGGIVATPAAQAQLVAHGRRGINNLEHIPNPWFVFCRDLQPIPGATPHSYAPYFHGDILWSRLEQVYECSGEALQTGGSVQDTVGAIEARVRPRAERMGQPLDLPGDLDERFLNGEIPLFSSTHSGRPPEVLPEDVDQIAYMYFSSQRPGVRVREDITEDYTFPAGYWRFDTLYDDQEGVGLLGDLPNDYKFQYIGAVYRDLETGHSEYLSQGTGWVHLPLEGDPLGSRVMPPFAGPGNGGWTAEGGPLMTLKGQDVHIFIQPTATWPGAILQVGDTFRFAGHIMPPLDSRVAVTVTAPDGRAFTGGGRANHVGYFYDPVDDFMVDEPGVWTVAVRVWHEGSCSGGQTIPPYPSGDVLGSEEGTFVFYVVEPGASRLPVLEPDGDFLDFSGGVTPVTVAGAAPAGLTQSVVDYTITMPGFILRHGQVPVSDGGFEVVFDAVELAQGFPNLDLIGRAHPDQPGLADTITISMLLSGRDEGGEPGYQANMLVLQGQRVLVRNGPDWTPQHTFLPVVL